MRRGQLFVDLPRFMAWRTPQWLLRLNLLSLIVLTVPILMGYRLAMGLFTVVVLGNFAWGYVAWRRAGRPVVDALPPLEFKALAKVWRDRDRRS